MNTVGIRQEYGMNTVGTRPNQSFSYLFKLFLEEQQNNSEDCWLALVEPADIDECIKTEFAAWVFKQLKNWVSITDVCTEFRVEEILCPIRESKFTTNQIKGDSQNVG